MPSIAPSTSFQVLVLKDLGGEAKLYKPRKLHAKTKLGCLACRVKRVKCDETKPSCVRCRRNRRSCAYDEAPFTATSTTHAFSHHKRLNNTPNHRLATTTLVPFPLPSSKSGTPALHLLSHLVTHAPTILSMPHSSSTLVLSLSQSSPLIRDAILALTACHLRCIAPSVPEHRVAEHFQQAVTLEEFQGMLGMKQEELGQERANAMMMCALLLNVHAFVLPMRDSTTTSTSSFISQPTSTWDFDWLGLQAGLRPLFVYMAPYMSQSIAFMESIFLMPSNSIAERARHSTWAAAALAQGYRQMPELWAEHFGILRCVGDLEDVFTRTYTPGHGSIVAGAVEAKGDGNVDMIIDVDTDAEMDVHRDCLGPTAPLIFRQDAITMLVHHNEMSPATSTTSTSTPHSFASEGSTISSDAHSTPTTANIYTIAASILSFLHSSSSNSSPSSCSSSSPASTNTRHETTNIFPLLQFAVKATPAFRLALSMRDERALFLYCYWLKLMRDVRPDGGEVGEEGQGGTWWSRGRVAQESEDISRYLVSLRLAERDGAEGRRWAVLMGELALARGRT